MPVTSTFFDSSLYRSMLKLISTPTELGRSGSPRLGQLPGSSHGSLSRRRQSRARRLSTAIPKNRLKEKKEVTGIRKTMAAAAIAGSMLVEHRDLDLRADHLVRLGKAPGRSDEIDVMGREDQAQLAALDLGQHVHAQGQVVRVDVALTDESDVLRLRVRALHEADRRPEGHQRREVGHSPVQVCLERDSNPLRLGTQ